MKPSLAVPVSNFHGIPMAPSCGVPVIGHDIHKLNERTVEDELDHGKRKLVLSAHFARAVSHNLCYEHRSSRTN